MAASLYGLYWLVLFDFFSPYKWNTSVHICIFSNVSSLFRDPLHFVAAVWTGNDQMMTAKGMRQRFNTCDRRRNQEFVESSVGQELRGRLFKESTDFVSSALLCHHSVNRPPVKTVLFRNHQAN